MLLVFWLGLCSYTKHCRWVTSEAYSSPSIVLISGWGPHRVVLDDFREAYYWLRHNTAQDAKIMSWWVAGLARVGWVEGAAAGVGRGEAGSCGRVGGGRKDTQGLDAGYVCGEGGGSNCVCVGGWGGVQRGGEGG
jgi:hypothetical protein